MDFVKFPGRCEPSSSSVFFAVLGMDGKSPNFFKASRGVEDPQDAD